MNELTEQHIATLKDAAAKLTGAKRRAFQARVTLDYLDGSARKAERVFGWWRKTVELGLNELRTGITCLDNTSARGNRKTEEKLPALEEDIRALVRDQQSALYKRYSGEPGLLVRYFPAIGHVLCERGILCGRSCQPGLIYVEGANHNPLQ